MQISRSMVQNWWKDKVTNVDVLQRVYKTKVS